MPFFFLALLFASFHQPFTRTAALDSTPPHAYINAGPPFTNATNVSVTILLTQLCPGHGGFKCPTVQACDLLVSGAGKVIPSTLTVLQPSLEYRIAVELSSKYSTGKIVLRLANRFCTDSHGNEFESSETSRAVVRFDRKAFLVNLWTAIPDKLVKINSQDRTLQATNSISRIRIYVDFNIPISNSSDELTSAMQASTGNLVMAHRNSRGQRRFGYSLVNISDLTVVTVSLKANTVISRTGASLSAELSTISVTFLYDFVRPRVQLGTSSTLYNYKGATVPVFVQFTEPVFLFGSSGILVSGGVLKSFGEISKTNYLLNVLTNDDVLSVSVLENSTADIAGNTNSASNILQVRHYSVPSISIVLYSFTAAAMVVTSFTAGALCISAASLVAAGAMSTQSASLMDTNPSRNLLGMTSHLQVFALSEWLAVSLPVEYQETASGLQWLVPRLNPPWEKQKPDSSDLRTPLIKERSLTEVTNDHLSIIIDGDPGSSASFKRKLGANASMFGPPLSASEYQVFFEGEANKPEADVAIGGNSYSGWHDFEKNMWGLGVFGGVFLLLHVLMLPYLKWIMGSQLKGAIILPRFELFLLILALPSMCQASAFLLRGGTRTGIIVGVLLLSIPAAFLLSVLLFLSVAVLLGALVLYKESKHYKTSRCRDLLSVIAGSDASGEWLPMEGLAQSFLARFGLLFEDRKGPPKQQFVKDHPRSKSKSVDGTKSVRSSYSDDETDTGISVPRFRKIFGACRSSYIVIDLARRVILGTAFGMYARSDSSQSQILLVLISTVVQLLYLAICKPYISKLVQTVETISLICEAGIFGAALALLRREHADKNVALFMLALFLVSFISQVGNEWYALIKRLMSFAPDKKGSLGLPLKMVAIGLSIPLLPRPIWAKLLPSPEVTPKTGSRKGKLVLEEDKEKEIEEDVEEEPMSEIKPECSKKGKSVARLQDTTGASSSSREMKLLRELARASFRSSSIVKEEEQFPIEEVTE